MGEQVERLEAELRGMKIRRAKGVANSAVEQAVSALEFALEAIEACQQENERLRERLNDGPDGA